MEYLDGLGLFGKFLGTIGNVLAGVVAIIGGVVLLLVPEPTGLTKVGGIAAIVAGIGSLIAIAGYWA